MLTRIFFTIVFLSLLVFTFACKPSVTDDETTPDMAKSVLKLRGYDLNEKGLFKAIAREDVLSVGGFLNAGIDPNAKNEKGETALTYALDTQESDKIAKILIRKADVSKQDDLGNSPLHLAIIKNKDKIFDLLLEKGVDVDIAGREGTVKNITPLYAAVLKRRDDLVRKLLKNDADPNIADSEGSFPLIDAVFQKAANPEIVEILLDNGAEVDKKNIDGVTALIYAVSNQDVTSETRQKIVRQLLDNGADKTIKGKDGRDALAWAKKLKNEETAKILE